MKATGEEAVQPGQVVGGYRVDKKLGAGGFGQVYLAHREGAACALKFLSLERGGDWGWRELLILMSHDLPHVVKLRGHFKWPEEESTYLVLVMEYVPGVTLFRWARDCNPSARQVVEKLLPLARALEGVHAAGVLHRDLKGDNVLVRTPDGRPVLVDFGAGALADAPPVTRGGVAPGNLHYRTPESLAFFLRPKRQRGERYAYGVKDELYALGVLLYVLLTDVYPFDGDDEDLWEEILAGEPEPPCEVDARVPRPLSALCLRLLAREPEARVPSAGALCALLEALLTQAQGDPSWEVPLCYDGTEQGRTTEHAPELGDVSPLPLRRWLRQKPKRGSPPRPDSLPVASTRDPVAPARSGRRGLLLRVGAVVVISIMGGGLSLAFHEMLPRGGTVPVAAPLTRAPVPPVADGRTSPVPWTVFVHEVAPPWMPSEAGLGAAPPRADTPVPVIPVTLRTDAPRMKKSLRSPVLLAVTAAANVACPSAPVRPEPMHQAPPPEACPPGAVDTMTRQLGLRMHDDRPVGMPGYRPGSIEYLPVKEGSASLNLLAYWEQPPYDSTVGRDNGPIALPVGTRFIAQLYFGEKRVYGRITQAITPTGDKFTVCMELKWYVRGPKRTSDKGVVTVYPIAQVQTVERFE